jgi:hypothetical protein
VYTAPIQQNYSGLPYLDPNNLNQKIYEEVVPTDFSLPDVKPGQNVYDPTRRPSDNLDIHREGLPPLQYKTYDMLDNRYGTSVFNAPIPEVHPKLRTRADIIHGDYINNLKKEHVSFTVDNKPSGQYPYNLNSPEYLAKLIRDHRPPVVIKNSIVSEPVGMTFKETFNRKKAHRAMNASALSPADLGQEELRLFARTGRWC